MFVIEIQLKDGSIVEHQLANLRDYIPIIKRYNHCGAKVWLHTSGRLRLVEIVK